MVCPNKNSLEWKKLVSEVGETFAAKVFIASGNILPEMNIINNYITEIKSSAKFFIVDKGMPFSGDLLNKVKLNEQKFTIRQNFHNQGIYKINDNEYLEVIPVSKEPISFKDTLDTLKISKNNFIDQFKGKSIIKVAHINDFLNDKNKLYVYKLNYVTTQPSIQATVNKTKVLEGDIFALPGIPVITTNLGGVHGAGLAQAAKAKGLITQGDGNFKATNTVVQLPVKKKWSDSMAMNNNMELLKESLRSLIKTARDNKSNTYLLPLAGLGHGEGSVENILPLLIKTVQAEDNIKLVLPAENVNLGRQGTVRKDTTRENMPKIKAILKEAGLLSTQPSTQPTAQDNQILNSPQFKEFYTKELESNPNLTVPEALDYYKKCKQ